jgi:mannan endo-1,4-beta-mannosidase
MTLTSFIRFVSSFALLSAAGCLSPLPDDLEMNAQQTGAGGQNVDVQPEVPAGQAGDNGTGGTSATGGTSSSSGGKASDGGSAGTSTGGTATGGTPAVDDTEVIPEDSPFVRVSKRRMYLHQKRYHFVGANYWQGMNLASLGTGGDREQLERELDALHARGIDNLRVLAASEGPNSEPERVVPALLVEPDKYDGAVLDGLDYLIKALADRNMKAVMVLGNYWHWSGGLAQYLVWAKAATKISYPFNGDWGSYQKQASTFFKTPAAVKLYHDHVEFIVSRKNPYTNRYYKDEPAIMAWELANEPRSNNNNAAFMKWIEDTAALIKSIDSNHLMTTGYEGAIAGYDSKYVHAPVNIDYATAHIWVENWSKYNPASPEGTFDSALAFAKGYLEKERLAAHALNKPLVLEEFGMARDLGSKDPSSSVVWRNKYFEGLGKTILDSAKQDSALYGWNVWAYAGESRPVHDRWEVGDPMLGDPPHEPQGWYSVYDADTSTLDLLQSYAASMAALKE